MAGRRRADKGTSPRTIRVDRLERMRIDRLDRMRADQLARIRVGKVKPPTPTRKAIRPRV